MNEMKDTISRQLQQLQMLMHRFMFNQHGKMHNPHRGQGRVLAILKLKPVISQKELTYLLNMSKQSVAELVAKLERSGYITREPSESDRRVMTIELTENGAKAADNTDDYEPDILKILDCLNEDELFTFSGYLGRIIARCEEMQPDGDFEAHRKYVEQFMSSISQAHEGWQFADYDDGHGSGHRHGHGHDFGSFNGRGHFQAGMGHESFKKGGADHGYSDEDNE